MRVLLRGRQGVGKVLSPTKMRIGIQGELGSACHEAAEKLINSLSSDYQFNYLTNAQETLDALEAGQIDVAVIVSESPLGTPVEETTRALAAHSAVETLKEHSTEVRHCVMTLPDINPGSIRAIASHEVPLKKHREFLLNRFPDVKLVALADSGLAAKLLARGELSRETAVVAVRRAAELHGLKIIETELPANDKYLSRFLLVKKAIEPKREPHRP